MNSFEVREAAHQEGSYCIPAGRREQVGNLIDRINRRAEKIGVAPVRSEIVREDFAEDKQDGGKPPVIRQYLIVRVIGEPPKVKGWKMVAAVDHLPDEENLVQRLPDFDGEIPAEFRTGPQRCDHCHTARRRDRTFILEHDPENGLIEHIQVGRNCLVDFLGVPVDWMVSYLEFWQTVSSLEDDGDEWESRGGSSFVRPEDIVYWTIRVAKREGWVSRKAAREGIGTATVEWVLNILFGPTRSDDDYRRSFMGEDPEANESAKVEAQAALAWASELPTGFGAGSDYLHNLATLCRLTYIPVKHAGIVASLLVTYRKALGAEIERKRWLHASPEAKWIGREKERVEFDGEVSFIREIEGGYGVTTFIKWITDQGNVVVWFASGGKQIQVGDRHHVKATIKTLNEFKGIPQTIVQRAVLQELERPNPIEKIQL